MDQSGYWDSVAQVKTFTLPFNFGQFEKMVDKEAAILDIGCGYGRTLNELQLAGYNNLAGIDFSAGMISRGKTLYPELNLMVSQGQELAFSRNSFDAIIIFAVITSNYQDGEQEALISEVSRVLKPGGILCLSDFLLNDDRRNLDRYAEYERKYGIYGIFELPDGGIVRHHTRERVEFLTRDFIKIHYEETVYTTMNGNSSNGFAFFGQKPG